MNSLQKQLEEYCEAQGAIGGHYKAQTERDFYKEKCEELLKQNEELKHSKWYLSATLETAVASRLDAWFPEELMGEDEIPENADMSKVDGEALVKMIDDYTKYCVEKQKEQLTKEYVVLNKTMLKCSEEIQAELKAENEKLSMKLNVLNDTIDNLILKDVKALEKENEKLSMKSKVQGDLIDNLFAHRVKHADIDDGIYISDEYGARYIDSWNKEYDNLIKEHIETMNKSELDGLKLVFHKRDCIEFECVSESDEEDDE